MCIKKFLYVLSYGVEEEDMKPGSPAHIGVRLPPSPRSFCSIRGTRDVRDSPGSCFADVAQVVELRIRNAKVPGSIPGVGSTQAVLAQRQCACLPRRRREFDSLVPLHDDALVQSVRMPACHVGGRGFEPRTHRTTSAAYGGTGLLLPNCHMSS